MWEIVPENLEAAMQRANVNQSQLADRVGIKQPSIGRLLSGETKTTRALDLIAAVLGTTPAYLKGETEDPGSSAVGDNRLAFRGFPKEIAPAAPVVPIREIDLTLGFGSTYLDVPVTETVRHFSRDWIRQYTRADPDHLLFAQGVGDSMFPTLLDSDLLLIDCSQTSLSMADKIWAVAYADCGSVKRLRPVPGGGVMMLADNPAVPDAVAYDGELHILGRVVAVVRKM